MYCLKLHCEVRGYCRQKWVLQVQIICKFSNERTCKRNKDIQGFSCGFEVQNDVLFSKNDGSLYTKRRIVSKKTTAHFAQNDVLFSKKHESGRQPSKIGKSTYQFLLAQREEFEIAKIIKSILLARARTRAVQEFYHFCCHKCHRPIHKTLIYKQLNKRHTNFNNTLVPMSQFLANKREKLTFYSFVFPYFLICFLSYFTPSVTLVTAKKLNRCWKARATRTRESSTALISHLTFHLDRWCYTTSRL